MVEANARLIAAAPSMLAFLRSISFGAGLRAQYRPVLHALVAKATGGGA
jgi:hypothetical protein